MLIDCSECGRRISDKAAACPHCGAPVSAAPRRQAPESKVCPKCKAVSVGTAKCFACGWPLDATDRIERPKSASPRIPVSVVVVSADGKQVLSGPGVPAPTESGSTVKPAASEVEYFAPEVVAPDNEASPAAPSAAMTPRAPSHLPPPEPEPADWSIILVPGGIVAVVGLVMLALAYINTRAVNAHADAARQAAQTNDWPTALQEIRKAHVTAAGQSFNLSDEEAIEQELSQIEQREREARFGQAVTDGRFAEAADLAVDAALGSELRTLARYANTILASCTPGEAKAMAQNREVPRHLEGLSPTAESALLGFFAAGDIADRHARIVESLPQMRETALVAHQAKRPEKAHVPMPRQIVGEVYSDDGKTLQIWGRALPSLHEGGMEAGVTLQEMSIAITNPDRSRLYSKLYQGQHYYIKTVHGKNSFGHVVPCHVYGPAPADVQERIEAFRTSLEAWTTEREAIERMDAAWMRKHGAVALFGGTLPGMPAHRE
jgi:hypothetical protein